jgi:hypothetical protein
MSYAFADPLIALLLGVAVASKHVTRAECPARGVVVNGTPC